MDVKVSPSYTPGTWFLYNRCSVSVLYYFRLCLDLTPKRGPFASPRNTRHDRRYDPAFPVSIR